MRVSTLRLLPLCIFFQVAILKYVPELSHKEIHFVSILLMLFLPLFFGQFKSAFADPLDFQTCALDDHAAVEVAEPFQIQTLGPSVGWFLSGHQALGQFFRGSSRFLVASFQKKLL